MTDLNIITDRYRDRATVNAESDAGIDWLEKNTVLCVQDGTSIMVSFEGAQEIEQMARKDGLQVESR